MDASLKTAEDRRRQTTRHHGNGVCICLDIKSHCALKREYLRYDIGLPSVCSDAGFSTRTPSVSVFSFVLLSVQSISCQVPFITCSALCLCSLDPTSRQQTPRTACLIWGGEFASCMLHCFSVLHFAYLLLHARSTVLGMQ